jgi:hypothetical protein
MASTRREAIFHEKRRKAALFRRGIMPEYRLSGDWDLSKDRFMGEMARFAVSDSRIRPSG